MIVTELCMVFISNSVIRFQGPTNKVKCYYKDFTAFTL